MQTRVDSNNTVNDKQPVIRAFSLQQDIPLLLSLYSEIELADHSGMVVSEQDLRSQLEIPGHDLQKDRWVVEKPDAPTSLLASAIIQFHQKSEIANASIFVHPEWRQRGIGNNLLSFITNRAREMRAHAIEIYANANHPAALKFLQQHGFTPQGAYTELRLAEGVKLPPVIWPFGYTMQTYGEVQNLTTLTEAMNLSYKLLWGHHEVSEQEMAALLPEFNPKALFLVFSEKGRVVGISRVELSPDRTLKNGAPTGYIDAPGVVTQHRRLDLYRALVLTGIRWLQGQGQTVIEMESWGDKLEVLKMYRELGFKDLRQQVCYQKLLSVGDDLAK
jgi:mycothiol synthase